ncbi:hypothetical protein COLO4_24503 [Corchorus olitorius]|uniref:GST C-terminal domain-containing protein n=1 Tax=Corchorus olitorius TaxID=93759 RepID=A0A1R3I9C5_9ROSI|nr:hypothetical protein COLO4_24503 [Corchorus olitorius]
MIDSMFTVLKTDGEEQEKAMKEVSEKLELLEEGVKELVPDGSCPIDNESMGLLDLLFCSLFGSQKVPEEVHGMKMIHPEKTPLLYSRIAAINQLPLVIELTPPHDKMVSFLKVFRENALKSSST